MRLEFQVPTRGLIGYRSEFLTDTLELDEHSHAGMANAYAAGASGLPFAVLRGYRGLPPGDLQALARAVAAFSRLALASGRPVREAERTARRPRAAAYRRPPAYISHVGFSHASRGSRSRWACSTAKWRS